MNHARVGWLGGTFDPIHNGHLDVASAAREALKLEKVYLVPARVPPHRHAPAASSAHRLAMATLAAETWEWLDVSDVEMTVSGPSYTVETLGRLEAQGMAMKSLHVLTGADAFAEILTWKGAPGLLDRCHFVAVSRPGHPAPGLRSQLPTLASRMLSADQYELAQRPSIFLVDAPTAPVTATQVRAEASQGRSLEHLVPAAVASYIIQHELYLGVA